MADKRTEDQIPLGSGKFYMQMFADAMPTIETLFVEENRVGYIQGGASVEYNEETHEEKDDLGIVSKIITVAEEALFKCGLITWNGNTLQKVIDRCKVITDDKGRRVAKIGGHGNAKNQYYAIGFHHEDEEEGDIWCMLKGRANGSLSFAFATDAGSKIEPTFKAMPHDKDGTLIEYIEETGAAAAAAEASEEEEESGEEA